MSTVVEQTQAQLRTVQPRAAVLAMPEYHPPLAGRRSEERRVGKECLE